MDDLDKEVTKLFFFGINSIYPSVRDRAVTTDSCMEWNNDECWYPKSNSHHCDFGDFRDLWGSETDFTIKEIVAKLMTGEQLSKREIYTILYSGLGKELPLEFLEYALLCMNIDRHK